MILRFCISALLLPAATVGRTQAVEPASIPQLTKAEWSRLRALTAALATEEDTQKFFTQNPALSERYSNWEAFSQFVSPWRSRLSLLPETPQEAGDVDVDIKRGDQDTTTCRLTYHHEHPANAITIVKTVWRADSLQTLVFMKGFANIDYENATKTRRYQMDSERWYAAPPRPARK